MQTLTSEISSACTCIDEDDHPGPKVRNETSGEMRYRASFCVIDTTIEANNIIGSWRARTRYSRGSVQQNRSRRHISRRQSKCSVCAVHPGLRLWKRKLFLFLAAKSIINMNLRRLPTSTTGSMILHSQRRTRTRVALSSRLFLA